MVGHRLHGFFGVRFQWGYDLWGQNVLGCVGNQNGSLM